MINIAIITAVLSISAYSLNAQGDTITESQIQNLMQFSVKMPGVTGE